MVIGAGGEFSLTAKRHFPLAKVLLADDTGAISFLLEGKADAILNTRIAYYVWCLSHPEFVVIDYGGLIGKTYLAYPVPPNHTQWLSFLHHWMELKQQSGFHDRMVRYWIKGEKLEAQAPRWSVIRDVLHWVD